MRRTARKLATETELYTAAVQALMRRAHSVHEMGRLLTRRAEDAGLIDAVLDRLKQHQYLDDSRYALEYTRSHARARRQGRFRIARDLRARGVPNRHIQAALEAVFAEVDEAALLRARLQRHLANLRGKLDARKTASLYHSLMRAGFSPDVIRAELRGAARCAHPRGNRVAAPRSPEYRHSVRVAA
jgi:regulatory protein